MRKGVALFSSFFLFSVLAPSISLAEVKKEETSNATKQETPKTEKKEKKEKKKRREIGC
ncbi:MAG: hypothetical protein ACP5KO_06400 [Caldimicrobium sp.]|jgi:lipopolysaccharide export LptBFGC system permease protein LptF